MPMPDGLDWNMDWEQFMYTNPSGLDIFQDSKFVKPFIDAINERAWAAGFKQMYGYDSLLAPFPSQIADQLVVHPFASGQTAFYSKHLESAQPTTIDEPPVAPVFGYIPNVTVPTASGSSWPQLQAMTIALSRYFVKSIDNLTFTRPSGTRKAAFWFYTGGGISPPPFEFFPQSGFRGCSPKLVNDEITYNSSLGRMSWSSANKTLGSRGYLPNSGTYYVRDVWPLPSGFRRKFPRELWTLDLPYASGVDGQIARFTVRHGGNTFTSTRWDTTTIGDPTYGSGVLTPAKYFPLSGKIMRYSAASGAWLLYENQLANPDIIETHGLARPGDYFGPWILNDLKNALNDMTMTWGWLHPGSVSNIDGSVVISVGGRYGYDTRIQEFVIGGDEIHSLPRHYYGANPSFWIFGDNYQKGFSIDYENPIFNVPDEDFCASEEEPFPPLGTDWTSYYQCIWDHLPISSGNGLFDSTQLPIAGWHFGHELGLDAGAFSPPAEPSGVDYTWEIQAVRSYTRIRPSGHEYANGRLNRTYRFYMMSFPFEGVSPYEVQFDDNGDIAGEYSPTLFDGTVDRTHMEDSYTFEEVGNITTNNWYDAIVTIGDTSLSMPNQAYAGSSRGYQASELIATAEWDFEYGPDP